MWEWDQYVCYPYVWQANVSLIEWEWRWVAMTEGGGKCRKAMNQNNTFMGCKRIWRFYDCMSQYRHLAICTWISYVTISVRDCSNRPVFLMLLWLFQLNVPLFTCFQVVGALFVAAGIWAFHDRVSILYLLVFLHFSTPVLKSKVWVPCCYKLLLHNEEGEGRPGDVCDKTYGKIVSTLPSYFVQFCSQIFVSCFWLIWQIMQNKDVSQ